MNNIFELENAVFIQNQQVRTDSLKVAEIFSKNHKDVLRKIESLDCSPEFTSAQFCAHVKSVEIGNGAIRESKYYEMTKDGFIFLVMGFTGEKAAQIKEAYIKAFNSMAVLLHNQQFVVQGIQYGTKVQLISGSPEFTVDGLNYDEEGYLRSVNVVCWNKNRLIKETLSVTSVVPAKSIMGGALDKFWKSVHDFGLDKLNHSRNPNLIALHIKQLYESIPDLPQKTDLAIILMSSRSPHAKYIQHNFTVRSVHTEKAMKCWVFDTTNPNQALGYGGSE